MEELIIRIAQAAGAIFARIDPALLGVYGPVQTQLYWAYTDLY